MKNKHAFTLIEVMICLAIMVFLGYLSYNCFFKMNPKVDKVRFKNANVAFQQALTSMIQNPAYYSDESGFYDLDEADMIGGLHKEGVLYQDEEKFRNLLIHELGISALVGNKGCYMLSNSLSPTLQKFCYKADNGVIFGIPNTDFKSIGVIQQDNLTGGKSYYTPVTIYIDSKNMETKDGFFHDAIVIGVRADGAVKLIPTVDNCSEKAKEAFAQCDVIEMFSGLTNTK